MSNSSAQHLVRELLAHIDRTKLENLLTDTRGLEEKLAASIKSLGYPFPPIEGTEAPGPEDGYMSTYLRYRYPHDGEQGGHFVVATWRICGGDYKDNKWTTEEDRTALIRCLRAWDEALDPQLPKLGPTERNTGEVNIDNDSHLSPAKLAEKFDVPYTTLRGRLNRWRKKNLTGWIENSDHGSRDAKYLYRVGSIRHLIGNGKKHAANVQH